MIQRKQISTNNEKLFNYKTLFINEYPFPGDATVRVVKRGLGA
jgi:hypothetical protein